MLSPEPFLGWLYTGNYTTEEYNKYIGIINEQMIELADHFGCNYRKDFML